LWSQGDDIPPDYKVFAKITDAVKRMRYIEVRKHEYQDLRAFVYEADTENVREAVELVKAGKAKRYEDPREILNDAWISNLLKNL
jgi:hypothetical protein